MAKEYSIIVKEKKSGRVLEILKFNTEVEATTEYRKLVAAGKLKDHFLLLNIDEKED